MTVAAYADLFAWRAASESSTRRIVGGAGGAGGITVESAAVWSLGVAGTTAGGVAAAAAADAALEASRLARCSSRRISSSSVLFNSLDALLNSARLFPSERPSSG